MGKGSCLFKTSCRRGHGCIQFPELTCLSKPLLYFNIFHERYLPVASYRVENLFFHEHRVIPVGEELQIRSAAPGVKVKGQMLFIKFEAKAATNLAGFPKMVCNGFKCRGRQEGISMEKEKYVPRGDLSSLVHLDGSSLGRYQGFHPLQTIGYFHRTVSASSVYYDDFEIAGKPQDMFKGLFQETFFIQTGNDNTYLHSLMRYQVRRILFIQGFISLTILFLAYIPGCWIRVDLVHEIIQFQTCNIC